MAEVNQDLLDVLNANLRSFEAAGPAFEEDVKLIKAKIAKVEKGETLSAQATTTKARRTRTTTAKKAK